MSGEKRNATEPDVTDVDLRLDHRHVFDRLFFPNFHHAPWLLYFR